jgi:hypothetical protein
MCCPIRGDDKYRPLFFLQKLTEWHKSRSESRL